MNNNSYNIVVHVVNLILLGFIYLFWVLVSLVSLPVDDNVFHYFSIGFMFVLWAINYWLQYKTKKKKWYLPLAGTVLYFAIVLLVLGYVFPFIDELLIK